MINPSLEGPLSHQQGGIREGLERIRASASLDCLRYIVDDDLEGMAGSPTRRQQTAMRSKSYISSAPDSSAPDRNHIVGVALKTCYMASMSTVLSVGASDHA